MSCLLNELNSLQQKTSLVHLCILQNLTFCTLDIDIQRTNMDYNHEISLQDSLGKQANILNLIFLFVHEICL